MTKGKEKSSNGMTKITLMVNADDYRRLRIALIKREATVSSWAREQIKTTLKG
jgi:peptidyl-tRNA hydrolase